MRDLLLASGASFWGVCSVWLSNVGRSGRKKGEKKKSKEANEKIKLSRPLLPS